MDEVEVVAGGDVDFEFDFLVSGQVDVEDFERKKGAGGRATSTGFGSANRCGGRDEGTRLVEEGRVAI